MAAQWKRGVQADRGGCRGGRGGPAAAATVKQVKCFVLCTDAQAALSIVKETFPHAPPPSWNSATGVWKKHDETFGIALVPVSTLLAVAGLSTTNCNQVPEVPEGSPAQSWDETCEEQRFQVLTNGAAFGVTTGGAARYKEERRQHPPVLRGVLKAKTACVVITCDFFGNPLNNEEEKATP